MKEIVKVLIQEGIDEETIHEVLDVIEAKVPDFMEQEQAKKQAEREANAKKEKEAQEANASKYSRDALLNLIKVVKRGKRSNPPMIK